jgi:hypothetical protein
VRFGLAANLSENKAWALYRERLSRFASLIGDREPVVLLRRLPGMGAAKRYIIAIADDDRARSTNFARSYLRRQHLRRDAQRVRALTCCAKLLRTRLRFLCSLVLQSW